MPNLELIHCRALIAANHSRKTLQIFIAYLRARSKQAMSQTDLITVYSLNYSTRSLKCTN